ncbi:putative nicotinate-nucleotide adenylyltransferase [Sterolibacterium denitrificans]|uniref:Probable nicotinate-nucleotide adenylyltransferase n=1 Tax=Sterolibacterium denitrificans TaxID=157592 RepID=A0A7Z7MUL9_9PROT|nr:nicotinate-nucleotide adenylyltransferase [Sterolibacterium denitrificans]SMB21863.1 putative nicotinate-nucleotide adenylyltransferase [Sterolibacterium denitrificans]
MPEASTGPIGILGGTFDPVHYGHLRLAEQAREQLGLAEVRWIPAGQPPHRDTPRGTPAQRLDMVKLAIAGNPAFALDAGEAFSRAPSYSVDTLTRLRGELGARQALVLLLGSDAFLGLADWHRWRELFDLAHIAVATRPGSTLTMDKLPDALAAEFAARRCNHANEIGGRPAGGILPFTITALDISATLLRASLAEGRSARYLLPDPVLDYIFRQHLYST